MKNFESDAFVNAVGCAAPMKQTLPNPALKLRIVDIEKPRDYTRQND